MRFSVNQNSQQGARERDEDRVGYCYTWQLFLFTLVDGIGGHPEGATVAQLALQTPSNRFQAIAHPLLHQVPTFLSSALLHAHRHIIISYATLVAAVIQRKQLFGVHCGDSRLYGVRGGCTLLRTRDHSWLECHKPVASASAGNRNMRFSCLGSLSAPLFDVIDPINLRIGDHVLLYSNGLWSILSNEALVLGLSQGSLDMAVNRLVDEALRWAGSKADNVSALVVNWEARTTSVPRTSALRRSTKGCSPPSWMSMPLFKSAKVCGTWTTKPLSAPLLGSTKRSITRRRANP